MFSSEIRTFQYQPQNTSEPTVRARDWKRRTSLSSFMKSTYERSFFATSGWNKLAEELWKHEDYSNISKSQSSMKSRTRWRAECRPESAGLPPDDRVERVVERLRLVARRRTCAPNRRNRLHIPDANVPAADNRHAHRKLATGT